MHLLLGTIRYQMTGILDAGTTYVGRRALQIKLRDDGGFVANPAD